MTTFSTTARPAPFHATAAPTADPTFLIPPHDENAEVGVLGSMICWPDLIGPVMTRFNLRAADFFNEAHSTICQTLYACWDQNHAVDAIMLCSKLKNAGKLEDVGGVDYITRLAKAVPTSAHAEHYAVTVIEHARRRRMIVASTEIVRDGYDLSITADELENRALGRLQKVSVMVGGKSAIGDAMHEMMEQYDQAEKGIFGLPTGIEEVDKMLGGMEAGELLIVGARPSVGKTAMLTTVIDFLASVTEKKTLLFSAEMPKAQIARRFACARAGVDLQKIRRGQLSKEEVQRLHKAVSELAALSNRITIVDTPNIALAKLRSVAFEHACQDGVEFIGIDYAQLIEPPDMGRNANRNVQVGAVSRGIKGLARELKVPIMLLAQLNRGAENERRLPRMSDLRESGDLEQDADGVILLHREAVANRGDTDWEQHNPDKLYEADIIIAKQRNGATGSVKVAYHGPTTTFMDLYKYRARYVYQMV